MGACTGTLSSSCNLNRRRRIESVSNALGVGRHNGVHNGKDIVKLVDLGDIRRDGVGDSHRKLIARCRDVDVHRPGIDDDTAWTSQSGTSTRRGDASWRVTRRRRGHRYGGHILQ